MSTNENTVRYFWVERFVAAHGKEPRGFGSWMFESQDRDVVCGPFRGTLTEAKAQARALMSLRKERHTDLFVCP